MVFLFTDWLALTYRTRHQYLYAIIAPFNQQSLSIDCTNKNDTAGCFSELIQKAHAHFQQKVVILIDEYDKPILDNITDPETAKIMREGLKNLYSVIKDNDQFIRFVFITGVSKFSKVSIFSGLNK